ncbi:hypothetical protein BD626DRAFT_197582 [Schizophyllum amplum]|uniref:Uncharacterized protein n=1 Tax=Schizophyllum amplum TaxID=97359 RepID=A0A550CN22_9AGAR|nr:hypothetical protein BD626DRAFT_197582 [Auriculariopsis ampla]
MSHTEVAVPSSGGSPASSPFWPPLSPAPQVAPAVEDGISAIRATSEEDTLEAIMSNMTIGKRQPISRNSLDNLISHPAFIFMQHQQHQPRVPRLSRPPATQHRIRSSLSSTRRGLPIHSSLPSRPRGPMHLVRYRVVRPHGSSKPVAIRVPVTSPHRLAPSMKHKGALRRHESFLLVEPMDIDDDAM